MNADGTSLEQVPVDKHIRMVDDSVCYYACVYMCLKIQSEYEKREREGGRGREREIERERERECMCEQVCMYECACM